jgi:hypothetical protein
MFPVDILRFGSRIPHFRVGTPHVRIRLSIVPANEVAQMQQQPCAGRAVAVLYIVLPSSWRCLLRDSESHPPTPRSNTWLAPQSGRGFGFAPIIKSHNMNSISTSWMGLIHRETAVSYCGNTSDVKLLAR